MSLRIQNVQGRLRSEHHAVLVLNWHTAVPGKFHRTGVAGVVIE